MKAEEGAYNRICPQLFYVLGADGLQTNISRSYIRGEYTQKRG